MLSFEVGSKHFVVVQNSKNRALLYVNEPDARAAIADGPSTVEESRRRANFKGIWVDLASVTCERLGRPIEVAWRAKAAKKLVDTYDNYRNKSTHRISRPGPGPVGCPVR